MRLRTSITNISGVPAVGTSGDVTMDIPANARYHAIVLEILVNGVAATAAEIRTALTNIQFIVNGNVLRQFSATDAQQILLLNGETLKDGFLPVYFSEPWRADVMDEEVTSWDLAGQRSFTIQISATAPATPLTLKGYRIYDFLRNTIDNKPFAQIIKWVKQSYNAAIGENDYDQIPKAWPIQRIHCFAAAAAITRARVRSDSVEIFDQTFAQNAQSLAPYGLVQQANSFPIVFDYTQQIRDFLPVLGSDGSPLRDLNLKLTMASAQNVSFIIEQRVNSFA